MFVFILHSFLVGCVFMVAESQYVSQMESPFKYCQIFTLGKDYLTTDEYPIVDNATVAISPLQDYSQPLYFNLRFNFGLYKALLVGEMFSMELCNTRGSMCTRVLSKSIQEARESGNDEYTYVTVRLGVKLNLIIIEINGRRIAHLDAPTDTYWTQGPTWFVEAGINPARKGSPERENTYTVQFNCTGIIDGEHVTGTPVREPKNEKKPTNEWKPEDDMNAYDKFPADKSGLPPRGDPIHTGVKEDGSSLPHDHESKHTPLEHRGDDFSGRKEDPSISVVGLIVGIVIGCLVLFAIIFIVVKAVRGRKSASINEKSQLQEEGVK